MAMRDSPRVTPHQKEVDTLEGRALVSGVAPPQGRQSGVGGVDRSGMTVYQPDSPPVRDGTFEPLEISLEKNDISVDEVGLLWLPVG